VEALTKETFLSYAEACNWLCVGEMATPTGRIATYVTPTGNFVYAIYNLKGDLAGLAMPPAIQQPQQSSKLPRGFMDPRGGGQFPG